MTERDLLELIANQVNKLTKDVDYLKYNMATKEELNNVRDNMATKEELNNVRNNMATKQELGEFRQEFNDVRNNMATKEELNNIQDNMATKQETNELIQITGDIVNNMATKQQLDEVKGEIDSLKGIVIRMENDYGIKINALFDGYKLNSEKLERIEKIVLRHEEVILRRIQ